MRQPFAISCVAACLMVGATGAQQQPPVFRGATDTVSVFVTVTDRDSRLVTTLAKDDFVLLDNGRTQQVTLFDNTPRPISLIVMLDVSGSMYGNLGLLRAACNQLFARLLPDDEARVGSFGSETTISPAFTKDRAALDAALPSEIPQSAPTPLWAALDQALGSFDGAAGRPVILVLSDGKDSGPVKWGGPFVTLPQVMERGQRDEVMIYSIGLRSRSAPGRGFGGMNLPQALVADLPDPGLAKLAMETGGGYFEMRPRDDLAAAFARVADELHSQYLLGFGPPERDGKRHKIEVKLRPKGLESRARKNYVAPK